MSAGRPVGMTVNSFSSLSLDPPLILWSVSKTSSRYPVFESAADFVVNVLSDRQISVSRHFTTPGDDKFSQLKWSLGRNGVPVFEEVAAYFECSRSGEHDAGDHRILIGEVKRAVRFDRTPLLFSQGAYRVPTEHPDDRAQQAAAVLNVEHDILEGAILSDLFRANHKLAAAFAKFRGALTRDEHRILISVERRPGLPVDQVATYSFLGTNAAEDALAKLLQQGLLREDGSRGLYLTQAGRDRRSELLRYLDDMERRLFAGIPPTVVKAGRELLHHLASD
jgi:flavin reductase (DIM6/NTAB) family NADH-FMN oxidoreductase RutF